ncbi:hypothetical protein ACIF6L_31885 [Kitasatospora sp. NPDC086009]|uniref:hypothetical protein n=1 Tax=unclassified Kitasatospora TaxID=2633591 RepID=UPI0037C8F852
MPAAAAPAPDRHDRAVERLLGQTAEAAAIASRDRSRSHAGEGQGLSREEALRLFLAETEGPGRDRAAGPDGGEDLAIAMREIAGDVAGYHADTYVPPAWWADHNRARLGLDSLARATVTRPKAVALLARYADEDWKHRAGRPPGDIDTRDVDDEIDGARVVGCILHLAGHPISAVFWWRLAAVGDHVSAFALYLHHPHRGELDESEWWFNQACVAAGEVGGSPMPPGLPNLPGYLTKVVPAVLPPWHSRESVRPTGELAAEVNRLVVHSEPGDLLVIDGVASRPGPRLATQLEELAGRR